MLLPVAVRYLVSMAKSLGIKLLNSVKEPFDSLDWPFELKLDGYRTITVFDVGGKVRRWRD